jgi:hypothetical protein
MVSNVTLQASCPALCTPSGTFLTFALDGHAWSALCPSCFNPGAEPTVNAHCKGGWVDLRAARRENFLLPARNRTTIPLLSSPQPSHLADYIILALNANYVLGKYEEYFVLKINDT